MGQTIDVELLDAFAEHPFGGNVAGVVLDADGLEPDLMRRIAAELNAPTTGFVTTLRGGVAKLRFFTPSMEIDMCGHVALGAAASLRLAGLLEGLPGVTFETAAGRRRVDVGPAESSTEGVATLGQPVPEFRPVAPDAERVAAALGAAVSDLAVDLPFEIAMTGLRHLVVGLRGVDALSRLRPELGELRRLSQAVGADTVAPFAMASGDADIRCRDFCIAIGAPEEAASGTTNSGLAAYLHRHSLLHARGGQLVVRAEQGVEMGRPSRITTRLDLHDGGIIESVRVEGRVRRRLQGRMALC